MNKLLIDSKKMIFFFQLHDIIVRSMFKQNFKNRFTRHIEKIMITKKIRIVISLFIISITMKLNFDFTEK